jgi:hypothetical protein
MQFNAYDELYCYDTLLKQMRENTGSAQTMELSTLKSAKETTHGMDQNHFMMLSHQYGEQ